MRYLLTTTMLLAGSIPCRPEPLQGQATAGDLLTLQPTVFVSAKGDSVSAEAGTLRVPENRQMGSRMITIAFVRFKSTAAVPGPPIIYLAGGPGNSGMDAARGTRFPLFMALRAVGDVIALDPRGVGESRPLLGCRETVDYPLDQHGDQSRLIEVVQAKSRVCAAFWRDRGVDLRGFTVDESADDIEALRTALGVPQVTLWAISYGVTLALDVIRRHPAAVHKAILAGTEGTDEMLKRPAVIDSMLFVLDSLVRRDSVVRADVPDLVGTMRASMAKLERAPVHVRIPDPSASGRAESVTVVLGKYDYQWTAYFLFGTADFEWLPGFVYTAAEGDFRWMAGIVARERRSRIGQALTFVTDCASGASAERLRVVRAEARKAIMGNVANLVYPEVCSAWEVGDLGEAFRRGVQATDVPALFISGTLDVRTPPAQAESARRGFRNSTHLIIEGAAHSDPLLLSSPEILDAMLEFLRNGRTSRTRIQLPVRFRPVRAFNF